MCGSTTDIQSATAEIRRGKKELQCVPTPNVMAALPNIGGALCSTPQSLADSQYQDAKPVETSWGAPNYRIDLSRVEVNGGGEDFKGCRLSRLRKQSK